MVHADFPVVICLLLVFTEKSKSTIVDLADRGSGGVVRSSILPFRWFARKNAYQKRGSDRGFKICLSGSGYFR